MKRATALLLTGSIALLACGPSAEPLSPPPPLPPPASASAAPLPSASAVPDPFASAPPSDPEGPIVFPKFVEHRLANGIRLLVSERHELPLTALRLAFDRGADQGAPGVGSFAAAMLFQGTRKRSALALSDELRDEGITAEPSADHDYVAVTAHCLSGKLVRALEITADVVESPAFARDEIERLRSRRLTTLLQQSARPGTLLTSTTSALLYPEGHPFHLSVVGDEAAITRITAADLRAFQQANLVPARLSISVAGDVTMDALIPEIERIFGGWKGSAPPPTVPPRPDGAGTARVTLVDRPGLTQSSLSVAMVGVPRLTPDYDALTMMNMILGGYYASRLNANLREKHGYTYAAQSSFDLRRGPGPFAAGATVASEHTGAALREIFHELARMREELVSQEELDDARTRSIRRLPARFETAIATAGTLSTLAVEGLPLDEFSTRPARFGKLTREDIRRVAATYLAPEALRVVVVGDGQVVKAQLAELGVGEVVVKSPPPPAKKAGEGKAAPRKAAPKR